MFHEILAISIASIQINRPNQCFESIASHITVMRRMTGCELDQLGQSNLFSEKVQRFARYNLGAGVGQETFPFSFKLPINEITNNGIQDGIPQELQSLVVHQTALIRLDGRRFMEQSLLIDMNVMRIKTQYLIKTKIRLLLPTEKKSYTIYQIAKRLIQHISSRLHKHYVHRNRMYCSKLHVLRASEPYQM